MMLGVWQLLAAYAMTNTMLAIGGAWQRATSLLGMLTWVVVGFGATNVEVASNGQVLSNADPSVAILAFINFAFCLVFFAASFTKTEDDAENAGAELLDDSDSGFGIGFGRSS